MQTHDELDDILSEARHMLGGDTPDRNVPYTGAKRVVRSASARNRQAERYAVPLAQEDPYEEEPYAEPYRQPPAKRRKKRHWFRNLLFALLLLGAAGAGLVLMLAKQPTAKNSLGARKRGVSTVLLAGVDQDGQRTDTLMLLRVGGGTAGLVSIPRDTLVNGSYTVPKINGVYGVNGGGTEGTDMLLQRVGECVGFRPDGLLLVDLEGLAELVDVMGGVRFDVPQDMYYDDPSQNLHIALDAGEQRLDGAQAVGLVRFRSGYAEADLKRTEVQRDFLRAAAKQWVGPGLVAKFPALLSWAKKYVETDLSTANLIWLGLALVKGDHGFETAVLPGTAANILGGSYYVLNPEAVAEIVNQYCNPYERAVTVDDLFIRN